jgi:hypothetical protein
MIRSSHIVVLASAALASLFGGCVALRPAAQPATPALSSDGVQVALLGQSCTQIKESDWPSDDLVEVNVAIGVSNPTSHPLVVHRDQFQLIAPDGTALRPLTWRAADPMTVAPGQQPSFELRFMTRGSLGCAEPMALAPAAGVVADERPLTLAALRFVPRQQL